MRLLSRFKKGSNIATIWENTYAGETKFLATIAMGYGKDFKTIAGAERFIEKFGYTIIKEEI